jgi:hypothetical protein
MPREPPVTSAALPASFLVMFVLIYPSNDYLSGLNPPNTTFLALPCFLGIMDLGDGTPTSAVLSGRW